MPAPSYWRPAHTDAEQAERLSQFKVGDRVVIERGSSGRDGLRGWVRDTRPTYACEALIELDNEPGIRRWWNYYDVVRLVEPREEPDERTRFNHEDVI